MDVFGGGEGVRGQRVMSSELHVSKLDRASSSSVTAGQTVRLDGGLGGSVAAAGIAV
jgi:hypothetical protein